MLLSIMDSAEFDLNNTLLSSSMPPSNSNDYERDLRVAAELGRHLLERNQDLQNYISVLEKQLDDTQYDMKLLHSKYLSTREELDMKCKQAELVDATNFDLEQELAVQRRENAKNRQQIKELSDLYEKTRRQCHDIEHQYETFRNKQLSSYFEPKPIYSPTIFSTPISAKRQRSNSFSLQPLFDTPSIISPNLFDNSSTSIFKSHLSELKSRIRSLTNECATLNDQLHQSDDEKSYLIDRITQLERQRRDDHDSLQHELNYYHKLISKSHLLSNISSPPEHDLSLYEEVLLENQSNKSAYEPTNYKALFARVYEKLKTK